MRRRTFLTQTASAFLIPAAAPAAAGTQERRAFQSVMMGEVWATEGEKLQQFCREAEHFGASACIANRLPDPYSLHMLEQPDNSYVNFTTWGPSIDQWVSSKLTYGLYREAYLKRNRLALRRVVDAVKAHGMKPWLHCGEPRFFPERFYRVYPHLRGPRVDNPNSSVVPLYAPCTDYPEIHEHYREMMTKLLREFPELGGMIIYSGDSGTGICHSGSLYPGPNGPRFCKNDPAGEKIRRLVTTLLEAARTVNPDFQVHLGLYIKSQERDATLARGPEGVGSWVNGYWVAGSLEDVWANMQYPGGKVDEVGYDRARAERLQIMTKQIDEVKRYHRPYFIPTTAPMEGYLSPLQVAPNPYQTLGMLSLLRGQGSALSLYGAVVTDSTVVPYDINKSVMQAFLRTPDLPAEQIVRDVALEWAGARHVEALSRAWRACDDACRKRPLLIHRWSLTNAVSPIVPNPGLLTEDEKGGYHVESKFTAGSPGRVESSISLGLVFDEPYRDWMVERFRRVVLPLTAQAEAILLAEVDKASNEKTRTCLDFLSRQAGVFHWYLRTQYNDLEAGRYLQPGAGVRFERPLAEIIDDEMAATVRLLDLIQPEPERYLMPDELPTWDGPGSQLVFQMKTRLDTMRRHRNDARATPLRS